MSRRVLLTGAAGFIGSAMVRLLLTERPGWRVVGLDRLHGVGGRLENLGGLPPGDFRLVRGDIADEALVANLFAEERPDLVLHFAAESHVDRSIAGPGAFVRSNVLGTWVLLEAARRAWGGRQDVRFHQVSTDEVFGDRGDEANVADETSAFSPRSPYAASKAAADHLVRSYHQTWGLPVSFTWSCNNLGPRQHPEKLVPLCILRALAGQDLPLYGDGRQVRRWLHVDDNCRAILAVAEGAVAGEGFAVGPEEGTANLDLVRRLCALLDQRRPDGAPHAARIRHVADRPGHDRVYHSSPARLRERLGWAPRLGLDGALAATLDWYLDHPGWLLAVAESEEYRGWIRRWYAPA